MATSACLIIAQFERRNSGRIRGWVLRIDAIKQNRGIKDG